MSALEHSPVNRAGARPEGEEWTPGPGWRQVRSSSDDASVSEVRHWNGETETWRYWVPGEPVPALPTVPGTLIEVEWSVGDRLAGKSAILGADGRWEAGALRIPTADLPLRISSFRVVSVPPMDDAAMRDRLRVFVMRAFGVDADETGLQYGVDLLQGREPIVRQD